MKLTFVAACLIAFSVSIVQFAISRSFAQRGFYTLFNRFFDSDPNVQLLRYFTNIPAGEDPDVDWLRKNNPQILSSVTTAHPCLHLFSAALQGAVTAVTAEVGVRSPVLVALAITASLAFLSSLAFFLVVQRLFKGRAFVLLVFLVFVFSFSSFLFGIVPESFAMSTCLFMSLLACLTRMMHPTGGRVGARKTRITILVLGGVFLTGITVSNIVAFAILVVIYFHEHLGSLRRACVMSGLLVFAVIVIVFILHLIEVTVFPQLRPLWNGEGRDQVSGFLTGKDIGGSTAGSLIMIKDCYFPQPQTTARRSASDSTRLWSFSAVTGLARVRDLIAGVVLFSVIIVGYARIAAESRWFARVLLAQLIFNYLLHVLYGTEPFLYSPHFLGQQSILLAAGILQTARIHQRLPTILALTFLLVEIWAVSTCMARLSAG